MWYIYRISCHADHMSHENPSCQASHNAVVSEAPAYRTNQHTVRSYGCGLGGVWLPWHFPLITCQVFFWKCLSFSKTVSNGWYLSSVKQKKGVVGVGSGFRSWTSPRRFSCPPHVTTTAQSLKSNFPNCLNPKNVETALLLWLLYDCTFFLFMLPATHCRYFNDANATVSRFCSQIFRRADKDGEWIQWFSLLVHIMDLLNIIH